METLLIVVGVGVVGYFLFSIKDHLESIDSSLHSLDDIRTDIGYVVGKLEDVKEEGKEIKKLITKAVEDIGGKISDIDRSVNVVVGKLHDVKESGEEMKKVIEKVGTKIYDIEGLVDTIKGEMTSDES